MGRNSKQRRDARRRRQQGRPGPRPATPAPFGAGPSDWASDAFDPRAVVDLQVATAVRRLRRRAVEADQRARAELLLRGVAPLPESLVHASLDDLAARYLVALVDNGWSPLDLDEIVRRHEGAQARPVLARWLSRDRRRHPGLNPAWQAEVDHLGPPQSGPSRDVAGLATGLWLVGTLASLPGLPTVLAPTGRPAQAGVVGAAEQPVDPERARKLATVRGLLAKAESSTFDEEAEAFSAKAQELISRYALEAILVAGADPRPGTTVTTARRIWLDAPYVGAKAQLVHEVAQANRCRAVMSEPPGLSTVVGMAHDIDAVELLVTSLLVQGNAAMRRHGQLTDARGASRTRSFRQSFLTSYAVHIGKRLRASAEQALHDSGEEGRLLPVLRSQQDAVEDAFTALVPSTVEKRSSVSNGAGWAAGQVAAELATLDIGPSIDPARDAG